MSISLIGLHITIAIILFLLQILWEKNHLHLAITNCLLAKKITLRHLIFFTEHLPLYYLSLFFLGLLLVLKFPFLLKR